MLIDRIYKKVKSFINTEGRGNVKPEKFNEFLHDAIQEKCEEYLYEVNRLINRENRGTINNSLENLPDRLREKISHHLEYGTLVFSDNYQLPDNYRYIDSIYRQDVEYEECSNNRHFNIVKTITIPDFPIYLKAGERIRVYPIVQDEDLEICYLRQPKYPKWTYTVINGVEIFNPSSSSFQDADIHPSEENEIVRMVLLRFGVNLKEQDIQNFASNQENNEFVQNNTD